MKTSRQLILAAALSSLGLAAQAAMPVNAADLPRISNGGTGFIGLTASAGSERPAYRPMRGTTSGIPTQAGEASTMVDGVPNRNPEAVTGDNAAPTDTFRSELRTMGQSGMRSAAVHPSWGTPE